MYTIPRTVPGTYEAVLAVSGRFWFALLQTDLLSCNTCGGWGWEDVTGVLFRAEYSFGSFCLFHFVELLTRK